MARKSKDILNLDGLISRQDLGSAKPGRGSGSIQVSELAIGKHYYGLLRKPHFQRETDDWSIDHVVSLIKSFRDGHLIPAIILWQAEGYTFVIDGAHRLSSFIAWVNDDYGAGQISHGFFKGQISKRQKELHDKCRAQVAAEGCTYAELSKLTLLPTRTDDQLRWSTNIAAAIETQWVMGDADMAATSFLAINQRAVEIDPTERYMIERLKAPNVVAARALVNSARGHAYWGGFEQKNIQTIESNAKKIYDAIFEPEDAEPAKDFDLQAAGPAHTANGLRLALDLVNITNDFTMSQKLDADLNGDATARAIEKAKAVLKYVAGKESASLSLHPAVYFWGDTGNHRPSIFLAMVSLMQEMILKKELVKFTLHRARLEEFLIASSGIGKYLLYKHGGWKKSVTTVKRMLRLIIDGLASGVSEAQIEQSILQSIKQEEKDEYEMQTSEDKVWRKTKAALRHRASLESAPRCGICKARLVKKDASDDHIDRQTDGGGSEVGNAHLTHKYCNSGFKEHFAERGQPIPKIPSPT